MRRTRQAEISALFAMDTILMTPGSLRRLALFARLDTPLISYAYAEAETSGKKLSMACMYTGSLTSMNVVLCCSISTNMGCLFASPFC
jgi:hypothetical protein